MNRVLFPLMLACILSLATLGCEGNTLAPTPEVHAAIVSPQAVKAWVEIDGVKTLAWVVEDKNAPNGTYRILYICDGPLIGPIQDGHCRMDGTDCQGPEIGPTGYYAAPPKVGDPEIGNEAKPWRGDPTADDAGDPDIGNDGTGDPDISNNAADADGIVVR